MGTGEPSPLAPRDRRGRDRPARLEIWARAVLAVALLAFASVSLSARRGLDWGDLENRPDVAWAQLLLGGIAALMVVLAVRRVLRHLRGKARPPEPEEPAQEERAMPWPGWVLAGLILVVTGVLVWLIVYAVLNKTQGPVGAAADGVSGGAAAAAADRILPVLLGLTAVLVLSGLVLWRARRAAAAAAAAAPADLDEEPLEPGALAEAVAAAEEAMEAYDDTRAAIIAAYGAMERSLTRGGTVRRASDTPTELLDRAVDDGLVSRGAALDLTELFREARFSRHAMPAAARTAAESALARVSAELGVRRG